MLSQIRQISDGNFNTVFVKNKEQKFNLDKEIHDLECWKQSRNHVYRKEEKELLTHLDKLRQQQEYLHHLDEERDGHVRGSQSSAQTHDSVTGSTGLAHNGNEFSPSGRESIQEFDPHNTPVSPQHTKPSQNTPSGMLPPVQSFTDKRTLHRTEAHTNICLVCQLPRWSQGHQTPGEAICCCDEPEGVKPRRETIAGHEEHSARHMPQPIPVGQRRHSLMMARLSEREFEYKPHPPERGHTGKSHQHTGDHGNSHQDHVHTHRHVHNHIHMHRDHGHNHHHHAYMHHGDHMNNHTPNTHGSHEMHVTDHHGHYSQHGNAHHSRHAHHNGHGQPGRKQSTHVSDQHSHHHHSNHHPSTPSNSPRRYSRQSINHYDPHISYPDPLHPATHPMHYYGRRLFTAESFGTSALDPSVDTRARDHELHWDRHQVCKLKGMITDPHYKEQLEIESGRTYPWSGIYPPNKTSMEDIEDLKNCRYLRFSKLNLMNMKENPDKEVEVFEKESPPP